MTKINTIMFMFLFIIPLKVSAGEVTGLDLIERCSSYANKVVDLSGDELAQIGETPSDIRSYVKLTCLDAMRTAVAAKNVKELTQWKIAKIKSVWGLNDSRKAYQTNVINTSSEMATEYYYNEFPDREPKVVYPAPPPGSTAEQKTSAMEFYSSQKRIHGVTLKKHCESFTETIPNTLTHNLALKSDAMLACQGVMVANITKQQYGIPFGKAVKISEQIYGKTSEEYGFLINVIKFANSSSK
ncbi:MAG: hypothetical protein LKK36_09295 [Ewingella americana]|jgi:hypothetical protein|uniref:hypothetical protein n=1 Tax=Ewingella americana TaxID=41202 RepID=UPI00242BDCC5|nr:hypothetical protein [Ewingella americana]MCI1680459.1 hypothetical protein [Ewingella americana]MCI1856309.1 hypothetical protein [Ewingella americana]MCI1863974.1 hypothetical protein [Ewingella americana]MCI2142988.1 hypothetical protein [Ewingella americana]MCI2163873.1 hypothetical protein [Ewingella americana]